MKLPKVCKPELLVGTPDRPSIAHPYLEIEDGKGTLIAVNGRVLVALPVEVGEGDTTGYVSADALAKARRLAKRNPEIDLACEKKAHPFPDGWIIPRPVPTLTPDQTPLTFPKWRQVVPSKDRPVTLRVTLNPRLLMDLALALGSGTSVSLEFEGVNDPVRVTGATGEGFGVLMPLRLI
jgi:hypothetical protein